MKVGWWVPTYRGGLSMEAIRQKDLDRAAVIDAGGEFVWWYSMSCDIARMRNEALEHARKIGCDYLFMMDDDIFSPGDSPLAMLLETAKANDATLTGAICGLRRIQLETVAPNCRPLKLGEVYQGERIGTGMVLIDVRRISKLAENYTGPWFGRTYKDERQTLADFGEDFFFCAVLEQAGHSIWIDGRVPTVHCYTDKEHLRYDPARQG